jgi:hypothetical protein
MRAARVFALGLCLVVRVAHAQDELGRKEAAEAEIERAEALIEAGQEREGIPVLHAAAAIDGLSQDESPRVADADALPRPEPEVAAEEPRAERPPDRARGRFRLRPAAPREDTGAAGH